MTDPDGPMVAARLGDAVVPDGVSIDLDDGDDADGRCGTRRRIRMRAATDIDGIATGWFSQLVAKVPIEVVGDATYLGFAYTQFALPVVAGPSLDFDFRPAPNLHSPPVLGLLLARTATQWAVLAPLDHPHEQVIAVADGELWWGWHGDLDTVPEGFSTSLGIFTGTELEPLLEHWGREVRDGRPRRTSASNPVTSHLSYWSDNGAAYWYRTEPGRTNGASVAGAVESLWASGVPVRAVELDSWCYDHEVPRPITEVGYPEEVPPSGMMTWSARRDAFDPSTDDRDPIAAFADRLGRPPLVIHSRHISPASPYVTEGGPAEGAWWVDALAAQPVDPAFFARWFDDARRWGACAIEQDWMLLYWFGVRALRAAPDRVADWQRALDALAGESGVDLIWCMATPADLVLAATLDHVVAVRTSDDYRFAPDPALLWTWYLTVNRLARALGLRAFKDCFFSGRPADPSGDRIVDPIDGDAHAEVEALLACMSAGPVGIGDRIGRTDREVVLRTCDADGRIRHVDRPLALVDSCLCGEPARGDRLAWATTTATRGGRTWTYVVALNTATELREVDDGLDLAAVGLPGVRQVFDWRRGEVREMSSLRRTLAPRDWALWVCGPPGERADEGDPSKYVTVESDLDERADTPS